MRNTVHSYIDRFRHDRHERLVLGSVLLILAIIVSISVYWQLRYVGITLTNETFCGYEEHTHTDECYEYVLSCELDESDGHTHADECYEESEVLVCGLEESEGHTHTSECYDGEGNLICGLEVSEGHIHISECYETQLILICSQDEQEGHTHTDECYEKVLICELEEHTHTVECLIDLTADIEDEAIWEATLPELTGDLRTDVAQIAYSQLGYTESTANYSIGDDGTTHYGYTRYGAWYGSTYADWDSIFVAFCLDYANIADEFTYNAGAYAWSVDLSNLGYYQTANSYTPSTGDIVFIDTDSDSRANISAIVISVSETSITVIQGNYSVTDSDGNTTDTVAFVTYSTVVDITGSELATLSSETGTVPEATEIIPIILGYANISPEIVVEEAEEVSGETVADEDPTEEDELPEEKVELEGDTSVESVTEEETLEETLTEEAVILTSTATDYASQVNELYTASMSLTSGDTEAAATIWDSLMTIWEQIYSEEEAGTLAMTAEEYDKVNILTDEVYYYFVETVGYDPYGTVTVDSGDITASTIYTVLGDSSSALSDTSVSWEASNVSYEDGSFEMTLDTTFTMDGSQLEKGVSYYIYLPEGFYVTDDTISYGGLTGYDENGNAAFTYCYKVDSEGNYYIEIIFYDEYVKTNSYSGNALTGEIKFNQYAIEVENTTTEDNGDTVVFSDGLGIKISAADIDHEENESWVQDLTITKSATSYNAVTNSITYTIYVSSTSGTGAITIDDLLSFISNQTYSEDLTISEIVVDSVTYEAYVLQYVYNAWYTGDMWVSSSVSKDSSATITQSTTTGSVYNYTVTDDSGEITGLTITLAPLAGASTYTEGSNEYAMTSDRYIITYTVTFDEISGAVNATVNNTATATSEKDGDTVTDNATVAKTVVTSTVKKSATFDSSTGYITWTITYNAGGANIAGLTLSDSMLADAVGDVEISISSGTSEEGTDYEYVEDSDGNVTGIKFLAIDDTDDDGTADSNTNSYTITYQTAVSMGSYGTFENSVDVKDGDGTVLDEEETSIYVSSFGNMTKTVEAGTKDSTNNTVVLNWTSTIEIPESGISSGTVIADYLGKSQYGDDYSYYTLSSLYQYFTYTQLTDFMDSLYGSSGKITVTSTDSQTGSITTTDYTYIDDVATAQAGYDVYNYTIKVYTFDSNGNTIGWVDYDTIVNNSSTYSEYKFTAWRITLNTDIEGTGTIEWQYSTTADTSNISTNRIYANTIYVGKTYAVASHTEYNTVYKTDGNGTSTDTSYTSTTGVVTWKVYVYVGDLDATSGTLTITDTLPDGVTFTSVTVQFGYNGSVTLTNGTLSDTFNDASITGSVDGNDVKVEIPYQAYSTTISSSNPYVILTYTTSIDGWGDSEEFYTTNGNGEKEPSSGVTYDSSTYTYTKVYELNNSVEVYLGSDKYGEDDQEQGVTHTYVDSSSEPTYTHDEVNKYATETFGVENLVKYEVVLNLDGETLNSGNDLTFTDILSTYYGLDAELIYNSVEFYELHKIVLLSTDNSTGTTLYTYGYTTTTTNANGEEVTTTTVLYENVDEISTWYSTDSNIYAFTETDKNVTYYYMVKLSIDWDYSVYLKEWSTTDYQHELMAQVPDSTAILVKYNYYVTYVYGTGWIYLSNTATLTGTGDIDSDSPDTQSYKYEEPTSSGSITSAGGLTIVKSGAHTSNFVEGVTFALWKYDTDNETWVQVTDGSGEYVTYTTSSSGTVAIIPGNDEDNDGVIKGDEFYSWYSANTLYYIVESEAPEGYVLDTESKYYFYWYDSTASSIVYPDDWDSSTTVTQVTTTSGTRLNISNKPITTFTLTKVSSSDSSTTVPGTTFALYRWSGSRSAWVKIGTYITDSDGKITITYDEELFEYNRAYMLTEETVADGYNIAWGDVTEFYFYWSSDDNGGSVIAPDEWGVSGTYASVIDLSEGSQSVTATNSPTSTTVSVTKVWIDENGNVVTDTSGYSSTVQLYYYVGTADGTPVRLSGTAVSGGGRAHNADDYKWSGGGHKRDFVQLYSYCYSVQQ